MALSSQSSSREQRLDFWRGLCLIDMVLVHLYYEHVQFGDFLGKLFGEYTRFAAGGFIFVSGLSIGVIFWPRAADDKKRPKTYKGLWRRSVYILAAHLLCALGLIIMTLLPDIISGTRADFASPASILTDLLLLKDGGDLLPFYVMMIALSPILLQLLRIKWGWLAILISSLSLYTWGLWHPWALAPAVHQTFPPILWQAIFILGLLLGWAWPKYNALTNSRKTIIAAISWAIAAALFVMEYSWQWGMPQLSFGSAFTKVPLSTPEALRYLSIIIGIITTTDVLWPYIGPSSASEFAQTLGRKSLPVYVLHVWLVKAVAALAAAWPAMGPWQIILVMTSVLILWLFALLLDIYHQPKSKRRPIHEARPSVFGPEPMPGAAR